MRRLINLLIATILGGMVQFSHAYTYVQVGVDSNLLIDGNRVIFAQSDGSLTMLDINTGQVLRREKTNYFSGTLKRIPEGVLVLNYDSIFLLNPTNLAVIWQTKLSYNPNLLSNALVSYDGNGLVENRRLTDGIVRWSFELPGALNVIAEGQKVLVHRAATYEPELVPTTVMLDLDSGKELFRKTPPPGIHWPGVFFDGESIYVEQASFEKKRSDCKLEKMLVWDTQGNEVRSIPINPDSRDELSGGSSFHLDQKTFYAGRVYSNEWSVPNERFGIPLPVNQTNDLHESAYDLGDGFIFIERANYRRYAERPPSEIELRSPVGRWSGELPYLSGVGWISAVARAPGKILIGSDLGHIECINATNGQSLWLYVFPTVHQTMSYSSYGMPPMMSQAAEIFRKENEHPPTSGLKLDNQPSQPTHIFLDPDPVNPFRELPRLLAIVWSGALIPLALLVILHAYPRTRQHLTLGPISILLVLITFLCFMSYGRVSPGSSIALRISMVLGLAFGLLDAVRCFRRKKRLIGAMIIGICSGITLLILPFLIRL